MSDTEVGGRTRGRVLSRSTFAAVLLSLLVLVQAWPVLFTPHRLGSWDWDKEAFFAEVQRDEVLRYHQLPFWNPYAYGGLPALAHPESSWLGPSFLLLVLPFGGVLGLKLKLVAGLLAGSLGAWALGRAERLTRPAALLLAAGFMLSGFFALHFWIGHTMWAAGALLPWLLLALRHGRHPSLATVAGAAIVAVMVFEGAIYILLFSVLLCLGIQGFESLRFRSGGPVLWACATIALGLGLAAVKLLPMLAFMAQHPRTFVRVHAGGFNPLPMTGLEIFYDAFLFPRYNAALPFEDGAYLGAIPVALAVLGVFVSARRRWPWYAAGALFAIVAMGDHGVPGLWSWLKTLPIFRQTIFPQRYLFGALLPVMLASAEGLDWLRRRVGRLGAAVSTVAVVLALADLTVNNFPVYRGMFTAATPARSSGAGPLRGQVRSKSEYAMLGPYRAGFGVLNAHPYLPHPTPEALAVDDPAYRGELVATAGTASLISWTPNVVRIAVTAPAGAARIVLNQNAAPGWRASGARAALDPAARVLTFTARADGTVTLRYRPPLLLAGMGVSAAALGVAALLALRRRDETVPA